MKIIEINQWYWIDVFRRFHLSKGGGDVVADVLVGSGLNRWVAMSGIPGFSEFPPPLDPSNPTVRGHSTPPGIIVRITNGRK